MICRSGRLIAWGAVVLGVAGLGSKSAEAQGLFQRLRDRVESRLEESQQPEAEGEATTDNSTPVIDALTDPSGPAMQALRSLLDEPQKAGPERTPELPARPRGSDLPARPGGIVQPLSPSGLSPSGLSPSGLERATIGTPSSLGTSASLGISVLPTDPAASQSIPGLVVTSIDNHSLADEAGLKVGDTIIAINGSPTYSTDVVADQLRRLEVGRRVRVRYIRSQKVQEIEIPLVDFVAGPAVNTLPQPAESDAGWTAEKLGLVLTEPTNRRGLVVSKVTPESLSAAAGIRAGDRIVAVDGRMVSSQDSLARELSRMEPESSVSIKLVRGNSLVVAEMSTIQEATTIDALEPAPSALGGIGSVLNGFFGGGASPVQTSPVQTEPAETEAKGTKVEQADEKAAVPRDATGVEQTGFKTEANRLPIPTLANDPPSLQPIGGLDRKQQLAELQRRELEIQLELRQLQQQIKQLKSSDDSDD